jgi:hypothetical protein
MGFSGFFQGDAFGAFAAPCISMAELYISPHLFYVKQFNLHKNLINRLNIINIIWFSLFSALQRKLESQLGPQQPGSAGAVPVSADGSSFRDISSLWIQRYFHHLPQKRRTMPMCRRSYIDPVFKIKICSFA